MIEIHRFIRSLCPACRARCRHSFPGAGTRCGGRDNAGSSCSAPWVPPLTGRWRESDRAVAGCVAVCCWGGCRRHGAVSLLRGGTCWRPCGPPLWQGQQCTSPLPWQTALWAWFPLRCGGS